MKVIIPAGGHGTRLRPLTYDIPKVLLPVGNSFILKTIIAHLTNFKVIDEIIISTNESFKIIKEKIGSDYKNVKISYIWEKKRLGGAGCVKNASKNINQDFIVFLGDNISNININNLKEFHESKNSDATLMLVESNTPWLYGVVNTNEKGEILEFLEKPDKSLFKEAYISTGIYMFKPDSLDSLDENEFMDNTGEIFPRIMKEGKQVYGYKTDDYWLDIGKPENYLSANRWILEEMDKKVSHNSKIRYMKLINYIKPVYIGENCTLSLNTELGPNTTILDNNKVGDYSKIKNSIVFQNCQIGNSCNIIDSVISHNTIVSDGVTVKNSVIGPDVIIEKNCKLSNSKIWPKIKIVKSSKIEGIIKHRYLPIK
jgi:NDP-sugar pyrophosphorylase family protein